MKLSTVYVLGALPAALSWIPFKHGAGAGNRVVVASNNPEATQHRERARPSNVDFKFNPQELLDSRKPEVYSEALVRLKRLEGEPICHRVAAQLLMNNCRGLEGINEQTYQLNSDHIQRHHVETFAASLTTCEIERLGDPEAREDPVPQACSIFSSSVLFEHAREQKGKLNVSHEEVHSCIIALTKIENGYATWLSYRDTALMFCRAADQHILLQKELALTMAKFSEDVHGDLDYISRKMAENAKAAESYLEKFFSTANEWKDKLSQALQSVSKDAQDIGSAVHSITNNAKTADHMIKQLIQTVYATNAEVSAQQELALQAGAKNVQYQMGDINRMMGATEEGMKIISALVSDQFAPMIVSLIERQDVLEDRSQAVLDAVINATELLQGHAHQLNEASRAASTINEDLKKAVEHAHSWKDALNVEGGIPDWTLRTWLPLGMVLAMNTAVTASKLLNAQVGLAGLIISEVIIWTRHSALFATCHWGWKLFTSSQIPSSVTHKAREQPLVAATTIIENTSTAPPAEH
ncbi:nuclear membrane fusion protein Kar5 [Drepanopeziza brunnea f. sp. 'multigermtubi' MB_m1]|uniref:Nuclear membrane fusion protein Kar5 n=1 Tax=Marssonina brunnea f. sp. multigermtubi (strain MB_m1) TaxID=1072389 RepID=K1X3C7_MARBU|nr:nuclear membrane fusion protein Kar5 [Drepanopeziza brunnea f. sp. 'multigermtubi' MB_m1]EKD15193.1 nuclear membrane fusion protein Kar5 [Drepanopeziza brunnea f. sp. 'multigermtubi' MB_m1]